VSRRISPPHAPVGLYQPFKHGLRPPWVRAIDLYLPPYSPDLSPIEPCWSKLKTALRKVKARTRAVLDSAIADAMVTVSHTDAWGWFKHCGYPLH
jgi:transposase